MPDLNIPLEALNFKQVRVSEGDGVGIVLHARVVIAGLTCHVEAHEVQEDELGVVRPVNTLFAESVHDMQSLCGDTRLTTTEIDGKLFVICAYPHAK